MEERPKESLLEAAGESLSIRLEGFEGPLDLLLHLIRKNRFDIYDIPISAILKEYLGVLEVMKELNLDVAGEFLVMAATLAHIKSRLLLPKHEDEEEDEGEDPRAELVKRLLEYERICEAADELRDLPMLDRDVFARDWRTEDVDGVEWPEPEVEGELFHLLVAFKEVLAQAPEDFVHEVTRKRMTIQDALVELLERFERLEPGQSMGFRDLFTDNPSRDRVVSIFLALLELVRVGGVRAVQSVPFGEIRLFSIPSEDV